MTEVKITRLQNKHKIEFSYSTKLRAPFAIAYPDRDGIIVNVFLKDGTRIFDGDIKSITFKVRDPDG